MSIRYEVGFGFGRLYSSTRSEDCEEEEVNVLWGRDGERGFSESVSSEQVFTSR